MDASTKIAIAAAVGIAVGWLLWHGRKAAPCDCAHPPQRGVGGMVARGETTGKRC